MDAEVIARWQFGITTVYHFLFVPITISMSMLVAVMQTLWYRSGDEKWLRLTKFYGKLFLINFAAGVVTGIVQEFQFGMNWSEYSRFVGDIFGAPLALEALVAFFLESTFLGLWIFGWDRLPKGLHLATIYLTAIGTMASAVFILAANSWMQNPVGAVYRNGRAEMADFGAVLTNPVFLSAFPHQISASYMVGGALVAGIAGWHLAQDRRQRLAAEQVAEPAGSAAGTWRSAMRFGAVALLIASLGVLLSGDLQGKVMAQTQPMKMASAEGLYTTKENAPFSILTVGTLDGRREVFSITVPYLLSFLSHGNFTERVQGINDLEAAYATQGFTRDDGTTVELQRAYAAELAKYELTRIHPNIPVTYWGFRLMMGLGMAGMAAAALMLWLTRKDRPVPLGRWWTLMCGVLPFLPLFANSFGWIFTEMGRQPWIVAGVLPTRAAVSPGVSTFEVLFSLISFTLVYAAIAAVVWFLFMKYIRAGLPHVEQVDINTDEDAPMSFAY